MEWDLGLPLLIMLATGVVMGGIAYAAQQLLFEPRSDEHTDETGGSAH